MIADFEQRTWFQLRAVAQANRIPFDTRWTRAQAYQRVRNRMIDQGEMRCCYNRLSTGEKRALVALQAANGRMPRSRFTRHFGKIRPCRQRHPESESAYWRHPGSVAEHLWLLGFIETVHEGQEQIVLTGEATALLPPLPYPVRTLPQPSGVAPYTRRDLTRDVAVWLGSLPALNVRPLHGRWLPPSALRRINARLPHAEDLTGVRSELSSGRLRFLHYLAEAAGLVAMQGGTLQPTAAAWRWLERPEEERWTVLWSALETDRQSGNHLWQRWRFPELPDTVWEALIRILSELSPGAYEVESLVNAIRPFYLPDPNRLDGGEGGLWCGILALLDAVLWWSGTAFRDGDSLLIPPPEQASPQETALLARWYHLPDSIRVDLPVHPPLRPLVELLAYAHVENWTLTVDRQAIRRASAMGIPALVTVEALSALCGKLPLTILERLQGWEREAKALRLQPMWVLTADDSAVLDALCADRGLRALVDKPLSAHHLAVRAEQAEKLVRRLERRGQPLTQVPSKAMSTDSPAQDAAVSAYAYLAMRVFQGLAEFATLPASIPAAARETIAASIPSEERAALDQMAARTLEGIASTIRGYVPAAPVECDALEEIRIAVRQAYENRSAITVDYFSPARGAITTRKIEPVRWYERDGSTYVEAWCNLDGDMRTFRLDRVLRVHPEPKENPLSPEHRRRDKQFALLR